MSDFVLKPGSIEIIASEEDGSMLLFKDAILASAEVNRNGDCLNEEGIRQLASTIAGKPIDIEHDPRHNCGVFTAGREEGGDLVVSGVIWAERYPKHAQKVLAGKMSLSVYAAARAASCLQCGKDFSSPEEYCECLKSGSGARLLKGLKAKGGALTENPASLSAGFDTEKIFVVSSLRLEARWWSKYYKTEGEIPDSAFVWLSDEYRNASPDEREKMNKSVHRKLPVRRPDGEVDPEGWKAAWAAAHGARGGLSTEGGPSLEEVIRKLKAIKPKDIEIKESNMEEKDVVAELQAEIESLRQKLDAALAEKSAAEEKLAALNKPAEEESGQGQQPARSAPPPPEEETEDEEKEKMAQELEQTREQLAASLKRIGELTTEIRMLKLEGLVPQDQIKANLSDLANMSEKAFSFMLAALKAGRVKDGAGMRIKDAGEQAEDAVLTL